MTAYRPELLRADDPWIAASPAIAFKCWLPFGWRFVVTRVGRTHEPIIHRFDNAQRGETMPNPPTQGGFEARIHSLPTKGGWDSYGAAGVTEAAKSAVLAISITPTSRGGIQLSWKGEDVYVEFGPDGEVTGIGWEKSRA